jgi:hypothetical protein
MLPSQVSHSSADPFVMLISPIETEREHTERKKSERDGPKSRNADDAVG